MERCHAVTRPGESPERCHAGQDLILRHLDPGRVETATLYRLTDLGRSLDEPLAAMAEWADANWQAVEAAQQRWDRLRQASD
jgi:DNA-binding HxlR family transcriptional regulator